MSAWVLWPGCPVAADTLAAKVLPMGLSVSLGVGRTACAESIQAFVRSADAFSEHELLAASRCHGWSRLEVLAHVIAGWHEMLGGLVSRVDGPPSVDAASYWPAFAADCADDDPVLTVMSQRRRAAAFGRPASATAQLHDVAAALLRGVEACEDGQRLWQGHVFASGDFLAVWAVENVVHQLDLIAEEPAPSSALQLTRSTIQELVGDPLPSSWSDIDAVLIGTGREPVPRGSGLHSSRFPVLG